MDKDHIHFMKKAFDEANFAFFKDEVPVGCVIVNDNEIISRSSNMVELLNDSTAHAELIAITSAQNSLNSKNLDNCILYTTLEPCLMCYGAIYWSKIKTIVYAAADIKKKKKKGKKLKGKAGKGKKGGWGKWKSKWKKKKTSN